MSYDIAPVGRTPAAAPTPTTPVTAAPRAVWTPPPTAAATAAAGAVAAQASVTVDTIHASAPAQIPASPPAEVHEAMAVAAAAYHTLQAADREVRFKLHEATGKVSVEIHDSHGNLLFSVPSSKALDLAAGGSLG
jgi:hypothetical protein